jgi:hypothetical protein
MTMAQSTELWMSLPESIKSYFYGIASKSDAGHTAFEFFHTEIPDALKSDPDGIQLLLDGGTVTVSVDTFERGRASTGTDTVEYELPDRDMSRIDAGVNGGDYTPDNVVLENASINRARGGVDMTDAELDAAMESMASDAELISDRIGSNVADVTASVADTSASMDGAVITAAESSDGILETVLDGVLPVTVGAKCAHGVWKSTEHMDTGERLAVTAGAGGLGVAATVVVVANPVGAACVAAYGTYKLVTLGAKLWDRYAVE